MTTTTDTSVTDDDWDDDDEEGPTMEELALRIRADHPDAPPLEEGADGEDDLGDAPAMSWGPTEEETRRFSPEQRARAFRSMLAALHAAGTTRITFADLTDVWDDYPESTGKPSYVYYRVHRLGDMGLIDYVTDGNGDRVEPMVIEISAGVGGSDLVMPESELADPEEDV